MAQQDDFGHDDDSPSHVLPIPNPSSLPLTTAATAPRAAALLPSSSRLPLPPRFRTPPSPPPPRPLSQSGTPEPHESASLPAPKPNHPSSSHISSRAPRAKTAVDNAAVVSASTNGCPSSAAHPGHDFHHSGKGEVSKVIRDMSHHHPGGPSHHHHHQHVSYPPSTSTYSAPSSLPPSQYASYSPIAATIQPGGDGFRASPVHSHSVPLPSMRTIGAMPQQPGSNQPQHHSLPISMSMSMPMASVPTSLPYYSHHTMGSSPNYGLGDAMARYALPHDPRIGSRGPKKTPTQHHFVLRTPGRLTSSSEVKTQEVAGPLQKRAWGFGEGSQNNQSRQSSVALHEFQHPPSGQLELSTLASSPLCDETHPTCNNCKKSKRDCLGYDPIFRPQIGSQPSPGAVSIGSPNHPSNAQPASSGLSSTPPSATPPVSVSVPVPPAAATARPGSIYGGQPSTVSGGYGANHSTIPTPTPTPTSTGVSYDPFLASVSTAHTPVKVEPSYDHYPGSLDPTLRSLPPASLLDSSRSYDSKPIFENSFHLRAKMMKIDEIIDLLGPPPPAQQISHTEETFNEITRVYHEMYASGLCAFFETSWFYFSEDRKMSFPKDANLIEQMASFLKILEAVKVNDHAQMAYSGVLETRLVWHLARTARQFSERTNNDGHTPAALPPDGDAIEAGNRLKVFEALLCGDYLPSNPLAPPMQHPDVHRTRQFDFWYSLAEFVRRRDNPDGPGAVQARDDILGRMRQLLDGRENRDVLYSIAVVRDLAPKFDAGYGSTIPQHLDETDPKNRLAVASKFLMDEAQVTGGTTNVVRRFSDIAARAFVNPGVNVARKT
ncbi:hypothetical protein S40288_04535 [Stachybotrys chartarum IBT 40288]|nr:hypothetical protein S40288_04535 [Stachybotrys chartarum IBT 40288]